MVGLMIVEVSHAIIRRGTPAMKLKGNSSLLVGPAGLEPERGMLFGSLNLRGPRSSVQTENTHAMGAVLLRGFASSARGPTPS